MVFFFINYNNFWVFKSFWKITFRMIYWFNHKGKIYFSTLLWLFFPQFSLLIPLKTSLKFWFSDVFKGIKRSSGGVLWKSVLESFIKFTGKHLCQSFCVLVNTCVLRPAILWKKRLWHRCFPLNFSKFLRTPAFL